MSFRRAVKSFDGMRSVWRYGCFVLLLAASLGLVFFVFNHVAEQRSDLTGQIQQYSAQSALHDKEKDRLGNRVYSSELVSSQQALKLFHLMTQGVTVKLLSFKVQPSQQLGGVYAQPVNISLEGDYAGIVTYLKRLESAKYKILWNDLHLTLVGDKTIDAAIELETLSDRPQAIRLQG